MKEEERRAGNTLEKGGERAKASLTIKFCLDTQLKLLCFMFNKSCMLLHILHPHTEEKRIVERKIKEKERKRHRHFITICRNINCFFQTFTFSYMDSENIINIVTPIYFIYFLNILFKFKFYWVIILNLIFNILIDYIINNYFL